MHVHILPYYQGYITSWYAPVRVVPSMYNYINTHNHTDLASVVDLTPEPKDLANQTSGKVNDILYILWGQGQVEIGRPLNLTGQTYMYMY